MNIKKPALYIHIPFCDSICSYCDFPKLLSNCQLEEKYILRLNEEIKELPIKDFYTIYIGGGTPTCLSEKLLESLLKSLNENLHCETEFCIEGNPESMTLNKAKLLFKYGINRVSLGVQSYNPTLLKILNRKHTYLTVENATKYLKSAGIYNFNLDFIYGLKKETRKDLNDDVDLSKKLGAKHLSFYSLQIEKGTPLYLKKNVVKNDDKLADDYDYLVKYLSDNGFNRYEVSNFSMPGFESKHNLTYWHEDDYFALGLGATSYVKGLRQVRTKNIFDYIKGEKVIVDSKKENINDQEFNYLMLNLRLESGFELSDFSKRFNKDFLIDYKENIKKVEEYLDIDEKRIRVKKEDIYILDSILVDLLHFN